MTEPVKSWSTLKVFLVALAITFAVMFIGNGVCNELLQLDVPTWVFSGIAGLAIYPVVRKWTAFHRIMADVRKRDQ
jgi:hypothetical protein